MKNTAKLFRLFGDETRLRILMLLSLQEMCVCHIMAVLGVSQPLVSRNLSLLDAAGLVNERREGKLVFYSLKKHLPDSARKALGIVLEEVRDDPAYEVDRGVLEDCNRFVKESGSCDMKTFRAFMEKKKKQRGK